MENKLNLILNELQKMNNSITNLESNVATKDDIAEIEVRLSNIKNNMATKDDIAELPFIRQAVLETHKDIKQLLEDQKSIHEVLGEHEIAIRTLRRKPV